MVINKNKVTKLAWASYQICAMFIINLVFSLTFGVCKYLQKFGLIQEWLLYNKKRPKKVQN